jgi:hypothetical protein
MGEVLIFFSKLYNAENVVCVPLGNFSFSYSLTNVKSLRGNKRPWRSTGDSQYIIDAGQKKFGATQCKECDIVYQIGDPDDEVAHQKYHNNVHDLKYMVCSRMSKVLKD